MMKRNRIAGRTALEQFRALSVGNSDVLVNYCLLNDCRSSLKEVFGLMTLVIDKGHCPTKQTPGTQLEAAGRMGMYRALAGC